MKKVISVVAVAVLLAATPVFAKSSGNGNVPDVEGHTHSHILDAANEYTDIRIGELELVPGPQGEKGEKGDRGKRGKAGADGVAGLDGIAGTDGSDGATGAQGTKGTEGKVGAKGSDGEPGHTGKTGPKGDQGLPGEDAEGADAGIAGAIAVANIPHARDGYNVVGMGAAHYNDGNAIAVGVGTSYVEEDGDMWNFGVNVFVADDDDGTEVGIGAGIGFHW